jgi:hypothetical protein
MDADALERRVTPAAREALVEGMRHLDEFEVVHRQSLVVEVIKVTEEVLDRLGSLGWYGIIDGLSWLPYINSTGQPYMGMTVTALVFDRYGNHIADAVIEVKRDDPNDGYAQLHVDMPDDFGAFVVRPEGGEA